jgi:hypothetical protein
MSYAFKVKAFKKVLASMTVTTTVMSLSGLASIAPALAVAPSDFGLKEGDTISASGSSDPDIYIVNQLGFKRLFLNPVIFGFYGHLGGFAKVKAVSPTTRDAFPTSGLFRNCETNDPKVYGVETTGEDTGVLHWVNTTGAQAVSDDPNFFSKVFCINNNEFNWYAKGTAYTSVNQVPNYNRVPGSTPTPSVVAGSVNVSLASDNPTAQTITTKATGLTYLKLNVSGTGTLSTVRVLRHGPGKTSDFGNVYLYDGATRLTSGRSVSSADGSVTFTNLNIAISGTKTLSVVADMSSSGATAGDVNYFSVDSMSDITLAAGTVGGSFPVSGNNFTVSGQVGGVIQIDNSGSIGNPNVGQSHSQLAEFKLTANTEGAKISRIQLNNAGTVKATDITNLKLEVNGAVVASGTMTSGGYAVFDLGSTPFILNKGDNRIFKVYGDLAGRKSETVIFYLENTADLLALGDQFGYGMSVTNNLSTSSAGQTLTLQGGVLTISFVGPTASNISTTTTKTTLLSFDMSAASNVELRKHGIILCKDNSGNGTYDSNSDTTNGWGDIQNVQIINRDTGVSLVSPVDGSSFTDSTLSALTTACPNSATGAGKIFTDTFNINAGQTLHLAVVGDVRTANTGGVQISSGDIVRAVVYGYGTQAGSSGDLTVARYANTNTALTNADIVPAGNISGNNMTVQGSSLTLALAANPSTGARNFVKGTAAVPAVGFNFTSALGSPVTVTNVTVTGYVADSGATLVKGVGTGADANMSVGALVSAVRLVDGTTGAVVASTPTSNNLSTSTGTVQFSNINWTVPAGSTKTLLVQTDLSTNNTSGSSDNFSFDIAATTDVTAIDANSNTINPSVVAYNGTTSPVTYVTVNSAGTLTPSLAADSAISAPVYWNQQATPFSKFKFTSTNEGFFIETLNLYTGDTVATLNNNIDSVTVSYPAKDGSTMTSTSTFNNAGSVSFSFAGTARPYVPKDGTAYVTVTANVKSAATLFRATDVNFSIDFSGGNADEFRAVGEGSGSVIDGSDSAVVNTAGNNMYAYRAYPQFTYISTPANTIAVGQELLKFKVDAIGSAADGATVFFDGTTGAASGQLKFAVIASGENSSTLGLDLRRVVDASGQSVDQLAGTVTVSNAAPAVASSASFTISSNVIEIPAGSSNTFVLRVNTVTGFAKGANTSTGRAADYVQIQLRNNEDNLIKWVDRGGTSRVESAASTSNILKNLPVTGDRKNFQ